ncbi:hypothetical protein B0A48_07621 [Cryoendolithus antarcticus]|uniref:N-acetyltransferase domain-containing protein n=1 Tax=Cryoendolithus antarcticus TaxID=1507870 RepID=A0A1V8T6L7_9PEZI|nr:hypothetical protein B0A48_07621 [Cryoendolithus antarcticus]
MINELATYENHASSVTATEESLTRTLTLAPFSSSNSGYARALILRLPVNRTTSSDTPNAVAGFALYFNNYSTWRGKQGIYLEDLFVRPQYRKHGYGRVLIQQLAKLVLEQDGGRLDFQCLAWNELALGFYRSLGLQAELARQNLYGTAVWHYPTDSHKEVSGLEELETSSEGLRETLLGLHLEKPEQEYEEDDQMVVENQTVPEEDDQAEDDQSREEILYDSDEASEYVRTPVRTRRTALEQEQDIAEQADQLNVPDETLLRRNRARSSGRRERGMQGASTHTSAYEGALRLLNPALFVEPDRQRAQAAAERNGEPILPYERPSERGSSRASGHGVREMERVSTHPSAYEGALRLLDPALFAKSKQPKSESADRKRKAAPLQQPGSGQKKVRFGNDVRGGRDRDQEDENEDVEEHESHGNDDALEVAPPVAREVIEIGSSESEGSSEEEAGPM